MWIGEIVEISNAIQRTVVSTDPDFAGMGRYWVLLKDDLVLFISQNTEMHKTDTGIAPENSWKRADTSTQYLRTAYTCVVQGKEEPVQVINIVVDHQATHQSFQPSALLLAGINPQVFFFPLCRQF